MATPSSTDAYGFMYTANFPEAVDALVDLKSACERNYPRLVDGVTAIIANLTAQLTEIGLYIKQLSEQYIIERIIETRSHNRPQDNQMETHIKSATDAPGVVIVGLIEELNKIINPIGSWGPYWRAQEYGTGSDEVKSQRGRVIMGLFQESGTVPDAQQGGGTGRDIRFVSQSFTGGPVGLGTIDVEDRGRHFLQDGFAQAAGRYEEMTGALMKDTLEAIQHIVTQMGTEQLRAQSTLTISI